MASVEGFRGVTAPLWPIRYKPLPDELLSSWLVRLARGHGLKVQTFCNLIFGNRHQVWNRDIDRLAPPWLVDTLALHTGTLLETAYGTTLKVYDGILFRNPRQSGHLNWVLSLKIYHRVREGFGQQFCPACLAEDSTPYFRKSWRLSLSTMCTRHRCMLYDRCHACGAAVSFFRMDIGMESSDSDGDLVHVSRCHECKADLAAAPTLQPQIIDVEAFDKLATLMDSVAAPSPSEKLIGELAVLRHLCALMLSVRRAVALRAYLLDLHGIRDPVATTKQRIPFESLEIGARHVLLQCGVWLLGDLACRLSAAVRTGALRYNHLLRDFDEAPAWYRHEVIGVIPHRRSTAVVKTLQPQRVQHAPLASINCPRRGSEVSS
jgi:hypothetical protein